MKKNIFFVTNEMEPNHPPTIGKALRLEKSVNFWPGP